MNAPSLPGHLKPGSYQGSCKIATGRKSVVSRVTLKVQRVESQEIHGRITTTGALKVDQNFSASANGSELHFVTVTPNKKLAVTWQAIIEEDALRGTFSATRAGLLAFLFRRKSQHGEWHCAKERFPLIRRLKTLAKRSVIGGVVAAALGGIIASMVSGSAPQSYTGSQNSRPYSIQSSSYPAGEFPAYNTATANTEIPVSQYAQSGDYSAPATYSTTGSRPQLSDRHLVELGSHVYDYALDQNRVDVKGHYRGEHTFGHTTGNHPAA